MPILALNNVSYRYEGSKKEVLKQININFEKGRFHVILGKSGVGKSTLLSLISGFDTVTSGEILYHRKDIKSINHDEYRAKHVAVIFQESNLLKHASAIENLILAMEISEVKEKNKIDFAYETLRQIGINQKRANQKILKLSNGEQQRVALARALVFNSDILIVDEPTGNLEEETPTDLMNFLIKIAHEQNKCVIVATQSREVAAFADEIWGLNAGRISFVR